MSSIAANLQDVYSSWEDQNMDQVHELADVVSLSEKAVIMGDLNCGPVIPDGGPGEFSGTCGLCKSVSCGTLTTTHITT